MGADKNLSTTLGQRNDAIGTDAGAVAVRETIRRHALSLGFAACGFTDADELDCGPLLEGWVARGRHGLMDYLARDPAARVSPRRSLASARSVIVVVHPYDGAAAPDPDWRQRLTGRIAAYAFGVDYHLHLAERLEKLATLVRDLGAARTVVQVDGGPLAERHLARRAGLGWYGRNTLLLQSPGGSGVLLGCLLTDLPLPADAAFSGDHCGTCRACIPACPTGALDDGPTIDARLCISYLTIELRGPLPPALRARLGNWIFGCDLCQDVCPWNEAGAQTPQWLRPSLEDLIAMSERRFRDEYAGTALMRPKRRGIARNAAVALGNSGNPAAVAPLAGAATGHDEPLVRAHAAWSLGELGGTEAVRCLVRVEAADAVLPVRRAAAAALARAQRESA